MESCEFLPFLNVCLVPNMFTNGSWYFTSVTKVSECADRATKNAWFSFHCVYIVISQMAPWAVASRTGCSGSRQKARASSATCQSRTLAAAQTWRRSAKIHRTFKSTSALLWSVLLCFLQENAHFSISESLIAAIELMKYNLRHQEEGEEEGDSDSEIQQLKQKIRLRRQQIRRSRMLPSTTPQHSEATLIR